MQPDNTPQQPTPSTPPPHAVGAHYSAPQAPQASPQPQPTVDGKTPQLGNKPNPTSTQNALVISELRDNMVILNDGTMRAVVACRSINFDLMSDREREAVEFSYQQFLNSLYFPVQILIRSQKVDLGPYMERLIKTRRNQDNMLLGVLMDDYIDFIDALAQDINIMAKSFFIVVPYYPAGDIGSAVSSSKNFISNLFAPQKQQFIRIDEKTYNKAKDEVKNRVSTVTNGLMQIGIQSVPLTTKELGELYYSVYNPDTAIRQPIGDFESLTSVVTKKGHGNAPQPQLDGGAM